MLLKKFLLTLPGFARMTEQEVEHIAAAMRVDDYPDGHVFVYQDKLAKELFLLLEGKVNVCRYGRTGKYYCLKTLGSGEFFGLVCLAEGAPSEVSYVAAGPVRVAHLPFSAFLLLYQPDSEIGCHFQFVIASQLARDLLERHRALRDLLARLYGARP
jgi:CRP-like cAMP-binding protein